LEAVNVIRVEVIPHKDQRYNTLGDWLFENGGKTLVIRVSNSGDWRSDILVAVHEIVEAVLCQNDGVTSAQVDDFDMKHPDLAEPGDDPASPYVHQHCAAMAVERLLASLMKYPWDAHENRLKEISK
jgi:hypothetical protein